MAEKSRDAVVKFDTYRNLQRHRAVLPAIARHLVCRCHLCIATVQSDVDCTSQWDPHSNTYALDDTAQPYASTLVECQKACEFDPRCVAVDWNWYDITCDLNTDTNHSDRQHQPISGNPANWSHYHLVSRCAITPGQCFDIVSMNISAI